MQELQRSSDRIGCTRLRWIRQRTGKNACLDSKMTLDDFRKSLTATAPPAGLTFALAGLWFDAKGDWTRAHESAQQDEAGEGSQGSRSE